MVQLVAPKRPGGAPGVHQPVLNLLAARKNVFITGRAGTGKSTLLRRFAAASGPGTVVLAPTGLAAVNVGGATVHSFFRLPPRLIQPSDIKRMRYAGAMRAVKTLVIDEASMLRADVMAGVDASLRLNKGVDEPFGGVQLVLVGDLMQLPPVVEGDLAAFFEETYGGPYFFHPAGFRDAEVHYCELTRVFRQTEPEFLDFLSAVRAGDLDAIDRDVHRQLVRPMDPAEASATHVVLTPSNAQANAVNARRLAALPGDTRIYEASVKGEYDDRINPTEAQLALKIGARVMLLRNDAQRRWVNGSVGEVIGFRKESVLVAIDGEAHEIEPQTWERVKYGYDAAKAEIEKNVAGAFTQLPLRLAWALTIHKAQGMTLDRVYVDFDRGMFAHGQAYVALSRCRTLSGLALSRPLRQQDLRFDPRVAALQRPEDLDEYEDCRIGRFDWSAGGYDPDMTQDYQE